jgi:hypothetical protein
MLVGCESLLQSEFCRSDMWKDTGKDACWPKPSLILVECILDRQLIAGERLLDPVGLAISG